MNIGADTYERILDNLHDGLYMVDRNRIITYWNKAAERISGFKAEEVIGSSCADNILTHVDEAGNNLCKGMCPLAHTISDCELRDAKVFMHHKNGHRIPVSIRTSVITDDEGEVIGGIELFTDISGQQSNEFRVRELEKMALIDNLTGLANRNYAEIEIRKIFAERDRIHLTYGIIFMDIDHFKEINDNYGHDVGDEVLKFIAKTFTSSSRPFDLYCRWGGEEFIGLIRNISGPDLEQLGQRTRMLVANSYIYAGVDRLAVTISVGATLLMDSDTIESFIKRSDKLMYESKKAGRNRLTFG